MFLNSFQTLASGEFIPTKNKFNINKKLFEVLQTIYSKNFFKYKIMNS